ncbi:Rieske 2Fe-2S domain-containing protein [Zavarzinia sp.]|uniref:Rieske 2Fe-2S domain-containing protein n=1 Tax=Zavarzinia sp. TaxID=2027920 RepID=UPI00356B432F
MLKPDGMPIDCSFSENDWHVLAGFWFPVGFSSEVTGSRPVRGRLLDVPLVLFRTEAGVSVAPDYCPHRGTKLSLGRIEGQEIVCKYHGLSFDGAGRCTRIPSAPGMAAPARLDLTTYPAVERYGLVWTCLKGEGKFPIPDWPELTDPAWQRIKMGATWKIGAGRHTENFCDTAHFSFAHAGTFGWPERPDVAPYVVEARPHGLHYQLLTPQQDGSLFLGKPSYADLLSEYDVYLPYTTRLILHFPRGDEHIFDIVAPVSARESRIFMLKARDHDLDQPVDEWIAFQEAVNEEDREMVESQVPFDLPLDPTAEGHLPADRFSIAYRKALRALGLKGGAN